MGAAENIKEILNKAAGFAAGDPKANAALVSENAEYKRRILLMRPVLTHAREVDVALTIWAAQGCPSRGPVYVKVIETSKRLSEALKATGGLT